MTAKTRGNPRRVLAWPTYSSTDAPHLVLGQAKRDSDLEIALEE